VATVALVELVTYLNEFLDIDDFPDYPGAANGLQVENSGKVGKIVACTDACQATIDAAVEHRADLMLVHHGLFWGNGLTPLTDRNYRRISSLVSHDIAVYSAHLPLDAHPQVGNNVKLAQGIGLKISGGFAEYEGHYIGVWGELDLGRAELSARLEELLGRPPFLIAGGGERVRRVGILSGGGSAHIGEARDRRLDTYVTGEGQHYTYFAAEEWGLNVFYAGHYATETLGVRALAIHLAEQFELAWEFIDHPTGL
jgi:dinuclear metal center YbgI/SA1388 family protein